MTIRLFTDPHIGRRAASHTTRDSSKALDRAIVKNALKSATPQFEGCTVVCAGDLFDKARNNEEDIIEGLKVASKCDLIVSGNHDLANRTNVSTSIEIVGDVYDNLARVEVNGVMCETYETDDGSEFSIIPHHSSQDLFEQAISKLVSERKGQEQLEFVVLHCNFNNPFAQNDSSLNLSPELGEELLSVSRYLVLGHEHNFGWKMDGRLLVLGNTHPTNFGDISDKFYWEYNTVTKEFYQTKIWDKATQYKKVTVKQALEGFAYNGENFIEISGDDVNPELAPQIAQAMHNIWQTSDENLYMVRNNVEFKTLESKVVDKSSQLENITKTITSDLEDSDLQELWVKHLQEAENA